MKAWMKILMWVGLGGGIGFFAGYQVGTKSANNSAKELLNQTDYTAWKVNEEEAREAMDLYSGKELVTVEEPEMPEEIPVIGDEEEIEEIPELHPQHMIPERITEEEYYENYWQYDQEELLYYEGNKVLFNKTTNSAIKDKDEIDQILGIGMIFSFYKKDGEVLDAIFVKNDTMGVIFRIDRIDDDYETGSDEPEFEEEDLD